MIEVTYYKQYHRVTIKGHAYSSEPGRDLVCAGASTLAYTLAANIAQLKNLGSVRDAVIKLDAGDAEISCRPKNRHYHTVSMVMDAVCIGFELMARDNPNYISYEIHM